MITVEQWDRMFLTMAPLALGTASVALGLLALARSRPLGQRVYAQDGQYLVSVRYGRWYDLRDFVQPDNPDIVAAYAEIGPSLQECLDFVCKHVTYTSDLGEMWQFPSETLSRTLGDCEDSTFLFVSLARIFDPQVWAVLGSYQGYGHAWASKGSTILETTYTSARPVTDPEAYEAMVMFNDTDVMELHPGALEEVFSLQRNEAAKLNLMAEAIGNEVPPECPSLWPPLAIGLGMGGILGTGFAMILQKGEVAR